MSSALDLDDFQTRAIQINGKPDILSHLAGPVSKRLWRTEVRHLDAFSERGALLRAFAEQHHADRFEQNQQVKEQ